MEQKWKKVTFPFLAVALGVVGMIAVGATGKEDDEKKVVDARPTVSVETIKAQDYQVVITSFGEVTPQEQTRLSAQVSGEVIDWHDNFVAGGLIARGEILFSIEKDTYEAAVMQAQATVSQAEATLIEEKAQADVAKREAKRNPGVKVTDLYLRKPQLLSAEAALKSAQAQLKIAERDLYNCDVRAPYDALIVSREIGKGQYVTQGTQVAELYNIESAEVIFPVAGFDTAFLPKDMEGLTARLSLKDFSNIERDAHIVRDVGIIDNVTRMSQLVARLPDPYSFQGDYPAIKFGSYVEVNFVGKTLENVYRLPQELVTNQTVWVVGSDQRLEPRTVAVLREEGEFFLINDGLKNSDRVVITLPEYPQKGMEVKLVDEPSTPNSDNKNSDAEINKQAALM